MRTEIKTTKRKYDREKEIQSYLENFKFDETHKSKYLNADIKDRRISDFAYFSFFLELLKGETHFCVY